MSVLAVPSIASTSSESYRGWDVFERFTEQARRVIAHAQEEAQFLEHNYIGPEHLLLGLNHAETGCFDPRPEKLDQFAEADERRTRAGPSPPP
jgi:hypothetical protein